MKRKIIFGVCIAAVLAGGFVACKNVWSFGELKDYKPGKIVKISYESTYGTPPESVSFINKAVRNTDLLPKMSAVDATGTDLVFDGWYDGDTKQTADDSDIVDSKTFVARWKIKNGFNGDIGYTSGTQIAPTFAQKVFVTDESGGYASGNSPRIPALIALPGKVLLAFADRRYGSGDLPGPIEVWCKRSADNGTSWDSGRCITTKLTSKDDPGMGDVAVAYDKIRDTVVAIVAADAGVFTGNANKWVKTYMIRSHDKGVTWDTPIEITHFLYGPDCKDEKRNKMYAAFAGSGNGIQMANGRLIFGFSFRTTPGINYGLNKGQCINYAVYSDDGGDTWQVSKNSPTESFKYDAPTTGNYQYSNILKGYGDEPKIVELPDGRLMMTIRPGGIAEFRYQRAISYSYDGGETWTDAEQNPYLPSSASNGDTVVYSSVASGWDKDRILCAFDIQPYRVDFGFTRQRGDFVGDITEPTWNGQGGPGWPAFFISYDGGETWKGRIWTTGEHGYSSFTILDDGSIGVLAEHGGKWGGGSLTFFRTNIEWITNGADSPKKAP